MKLTRTILCCLSFFAGCCALGAGWGYSASITAEGSVWAAYHLKEAEKQRTLQAYIALESKRTNVETELRRLVIAEIRKCRGRKC